ncbi:MAG TPA: L-rhamnose/proton symporter RhaT [Opitutaceae bacterium]|nr:L-rhamnose/proton symporter RhaT [Opitutaceae bacterium]
MPPESAPILGTLLHTVGAASAALCYAPQRYVHRWSWQTYWLIQAAGCWLILPWIFAWLTVPEYGAVLAEAPASAMWRAYLFGALYGVGGIAFGVAIRYIGFSLTYAIAIGVSCVLGTLLPPALAGRLAETLQTSAGLIVVAGVLLGGVAMIVTGLAGLRKEREVTKGGGANAFNARIGLPICFLAGALSAVFNFALQAGQPIADAAARHGAGNFEGNAIYPFSNGGAFTTSLIYVLWLSARDRSWSEFARTADGSGLARNYALSGLTGLLWYLQFFFYGLAHVRMGEFKFSSWAIHMIILIFLSCGFGVAIGEWKNCRLATRWMITAAIALLLGAVGLITYGNYLAAPPTIAAVTH